MTLDLTKPLVAVHRHTGEREDVELAKGLGPDEDGHIYVEDV